MKKVIIIAAISLVVYGIFAMFSSANQFVKARELKTKNGDIIYLNAPVETSKLTKAENNLPAVYRYYIEDKEVSETEYFAHVDKYPY